VLAAKQLITGEDVKRGAIGSRTSRNRTIVDCNLVAGGQQLDEKFLSLRAGDTTVLTLVATTTLTAQGPMTLSCEAPTGTGYQVDHGQVVAIQVAEINPPQG
jgi:hypothetical protein